MWGRENVEEMPIWGLLSFRGWGMNNCTYGDGPPQAGRAEGMVATPVRIKVRGFSTTASTRLWKKYL